MVQSRDEIQEREEILARIDKLLDGFSDEQIRAVRPDMPMILRH